MINPENKWPKILPVLTHEQETIRDEFMRLWHEELPQRYQVVERFNHGYPVSQIRDNKNKFRTLEIGAGLGGHLEFEDLSAQEYFTLELRPEMAEYLRQKYPQCQVVVADCQKRLPFPDGYFERVLAIHVLEHLPNLPEALKEIRRVLKPSGQLCVVIPCEGGMAYSLARNVSARRFFEKKFRQSYDWLIESEHINVPKEIIQELSIFFELKHSKYFPLLVPLININLCIGLTLEPKIEHPLQT